MVWPATVPGLVRHPAHPDDRCREIAPALRELYRPLPLPGAPPVPEGSLHRACRDTPAAEVALAFPIIASRLVRGAGLLALPARDAGIGPADLPPGRCGSELEDDRDRADEPAERAVDEDGDGDQEKEEGKPEREGKPEELRDPEEPEDREGESQPGSDDEQEDEPPDHRERNLPREPDLGGGNLVGEFLDRTDGAEVPAEVPPEEEGEEEEDSHPDRCSHQGEPHPCTGPCLEDQVLEIMGYHRREEEESHEDGHHEQDDLHGPGKPPRPPEIHPDEDEEYGIHDPDQWREIRTWPRHLCKPPLYSL